MALYAYTYFCEGETLFQVIEAHPFKGIFHVNGMTLCYWIDLLAFLIQEMYQRVNITKITLSIQQEY